VITPELAMQNLSVCDYGGQRIVDFMGYSSCKLPDNCQFFRSRQDIFKQIFLVTSCSIRWKSTSPFIVNWIGLISLNPFFCADLSVDSGDTCCSVRCVLAPSNLHIRQSAQGSKQLNNAW
jgi:hypothetical protein